MIPSLSYVPTSFFLMNIVQVTLLWDKLGVNKTWSILLESLD